MNTFGCVFQVLFKTHKIAPDIAAAKLTQLRTWTYAQSGCVVCASLLPFLSLSFANDDLSSMEAVLIVFYSLVVLYLTIGFVAAVKVDGTCAPVLSCP